MEGLDEKLEEIQQEFKASGAKTATILTLIDGDVPGQVGMRVDYFPPLTDETREKPASMNQVVALCISRLWDLGVVQALTGTVCHDKIDVQTEPPPDEKPV